MEGVSNGIRAVGAGEDVEDRIATRLVEMNQAFGKNQEQRQLISESMGTLKQMMEETLKKLDQLLEKKGILTGSREDETGAPEGGSPVMIEGLEEARSPLREMQDQNNMEKPYFSENMVKLMIQIAKNRIARRKNKMNSIASGIRKRSSRKKISTSVVVVVTRKETRYYTMGKKNGEVSNGRNCKPLSQSLPPMPSSTLPTPSSLLPASPPTSLTPSRLPSLRPPPEPIPPPQTLPLNFDSNSPSSFPSPPSLSSLQPSQLSSPTPPLGVENRSEGAVLNIRGSNQRFGKLQMLLFDGYQPPPLPPDFEAKKVEKMNLIWNREAAVKDCWMQEAFSPAIALTGMMTAQLKEVTEKVMLGQNRHRRKKETWARMVQLGLTVVYQTMNPMSNIFNSRPSPENMYNPNTVQSSLQNGVRSIRWFPINNGESATAERNLYGHTIVGLLIVSACSSNPPPMAAPGAIETLDRTLLHNNRTQVKLVIIVILHNLSPCISTVLQSSISSSLIHHFHKWEKSSKLVEKSISSSSEIALIVPTESRRSLHMRLGLLLDHPPLRIAVIFELLSVKEGASGNGLQKNTLLLKDVYSGILSGDVHGVVVLRVQGSWGCISKIHVSGLNVQINPHLWEAAVAFRFPLLKAKEVLFAARETMRALPQSAKAPKLANSVHVSNFCDKSVLTLEPGNLGAALAMAELQVREGRNYDTITLLERYLKDWADDWLRVKLSQVLAATNMLKDSLSHYEAALRINPSNETTVKGLEQGEKHTKGVDADTPEEKNHGDDEVQRTRREIVNLIDKIEARGNIKDLMATNRPLTHKIIFNQFFQVKKRKLTKDIIGNPQAIMRSRASSEGAKTTLSSSTQSTTKIDSPCEDVDFYSTIMGMLVNDAKKFLKLGDFGNAIFSGKNETTSYLVRSFYRFREVNLSLTYVHPVDTWSMWSVGRCLFELNTWRVLCLGATVNNHMSRLHVKFKGSFTFVPHKNLIGVVGQEYGKEKLNERKANLSGGRVEIQVACTLLCLSATVDVIKVTRDHQEQVDGKYMVTVGAGHSQADDSLKSWTVLVLYMVLIHLEDKVKVWAAGIDKTRYLGLEELQGYFGKTALISN